MKVTLGFDVYGTLIDTHGVVNRLKTFMEEGKARAFSQTWRDKQLEYSFRRGLMKNYVPFARCTRFALDYADGFHKTGLSEEQKTELIGEYSKLPAHSDVVAGLEKMKAAEFRLFAFSNGTREAVTEVLDNAGLLLFFEGVISVDPVRSFKPDPAVYAHFLRESRAEGGEGWLISGNPFDVLGATSAGLSAAWINRTGQAQLDPWEFEPRLTVRGFAELADHLAALYPAL